MATIAEAILAINSNAEFYVKEDSYDKIHWTNNTSPISTDDIKAKQTELDNDYAAKQYQRDRASAYKPIEEQLDMIYHDKVDGTSTWKEHIDAVKAAHPKPTE